MGTFDSWFNQDTLKAIAQKGESFYIPAPSADAFAQAFSRIDASETTIGRSGAITRTRGFQGVFIISGLVLLGLVRFIRRYLLGAFL